MTAPSSSPPPSSHPPSSPPPASTAPDVARPGYDPAAHGVGIVHIGPGAFFRAHIAVCTDLALGAAGGDWRIALAALRSTATVDALARQGGRFTVLERGPDGARARVIGCVAECIAAAREPEALLARLSAPETRIVTLTVTEKGYGVTRTGGADAAHPAVAADLAAPRAPRGVLGLLTEALRRRFAAGLPPFTVLSCDNLPENGRLLRAGVLDFAARIDPALAARIEAEVRFPCTMVDRITPAPTDATRADAARLTGEPDAAAVETEPFLQWVIEDDFPAGRPTWEAAGAVFVADVRPYEEMKLRMLNGSHSLIAYAGHHAGREFVRDAMADPALSALVRRHLKAAAKTLAPVAAVDLEDYAGALAARFANPAIAHRTLQIAMDGTEKLPQRLLAPALDALRDGADPAPFAFAVAAWMFHAWRAEDLSDPRAQEIRRALSDAGDASQAASRLHALPGLFPADLREDRRWTSAVEARLARMAEAGMEAAIAAEAADA